MSAHPAPRATRLIRAEMAGSSGLALGPNQRGKAGEEVEASISVMAVAHQPTQGRLRRRAWRNLAATRRRPDCNQETGFERHPIRFRAPGCWIRPTVFGQLRRPQKVAARRLSLANEVEDSSLFDCKV
jgi:hypothetical protein